MTSTASGLANAATRSATQGSSFGDNIVAAIPDVIGQAVGGFLGDRLDRASLKAPVAKGGATLGPAGGTQSNDAPAGRSIGAGAAPATGTNDIPIDGPDIVVTASRRPGAVTDAEIASYAARQGGGSRFVPALPFEGGRLNGTTGPAEITTDYVPYKRDGDKFVRYELDPRSGKAVLVEDVGIRERVDRAAAQFDRDIIGGASFVLTTAATAAFEPVNIGVQVHEYAKGNISVAEAALGVIPGLGVLGAKGVGRAVAAEGTAARGLSSSSVVSPARAEAFLVKNGLSPEKARGFIDSFDGPITARIVRPGEDFLRYFDEPFSTGNFLGKTRFSSPSEAVDSLALRGFPNKATSVQPVTSTGRTIVLEGGIRGGQPGVGQTVIHNQNAFFFGPGVRY